MKNRKTIREWLVEVLTAEEFEYVESIDKSVDFDKDIAYSLSDALMKSFIFSDTIQGMDYWIDVCKRKPTNRKSRISNLNL